MASDINTKSVEEKLGPHDAMAWASYRLVEVLVQREALEMVEILVRAAFGSSCELSYRKQHRAAMDAVQAAHAAYQAELADWFHMFVSYHKVSGREGDVPLSRVSEVIETLRRQAMETLDRRLQSRLDFARSSPSVGDAYKRMLDAMRRVVRGDENASSVFPGMHNAPQTSAALAQRILEDMGLAREVASDAVDRVLHAAAGVAPGKTAEDVTKMVDEFWGQDPPVDAQEAAYRALRILGYDVKVVEDALAKSLGFDSAVEKCG